MAKKNVTVELPILTIHNEEDASQKRFVPTWSVNLALQGLLICMLNGGDAVAEVRRLQALLQKEEG